MTAGILFTCTGRKPDGKHDRAVAEALNVAFPGGAIPGRRPRSRNPGLVLRCPVCGLAWPAPGYKARRRVAQAGITEVDISLLP
jgi:hypothetical protein